MYAVVGATGNTGRAVVKELKALGESPVCVVRNPDKAKDVLGADTKFAVAELDDRAGMEKAMAGAKRVFVVTGHNPKSDVQQINVIDAAKAAGAEYVVKVSGGRDVIGPNVESVNGQAHYRIEEHLKKTGLQWCILSPGLFMQNILGQAANIKDQGKIIQPWPKDLPVALIDVRDTGALGARVLREPGKHAGKMYTFTGAATTFGEFANVIGEVIGKPLTYVTITLEQAEAGLKARNMPDWLVAHLIAIARAGGQGAFSKENTQPIRDIVGRAPITTRQFAQDFKGAFG
ncbi:MAG: NAD-dependent epimerase/dehydratase family protein [Alphaproteobacteria bacterium]|nr:NAD-dependent epimerase/dehydratase family protein [Alphaproteobacteria bacterium]